MAQTPDRILDELLVIGCQRGNLNAFEQLASRWHDRLKRHAWHLTRDSDASAEIVQDAWVVIVRTIRQLKEPTPFRGWAFRIVSNKAADWIRRQTQHRTLRSDLKNHDDDGTSNSEPESRASDIQAGLQELPEVSRQILSLKYLDNFSTREIARTLDIPVGTVKSRLFHAREQLKQRLERKNHE